MHSGRRRSATSAHCICCLKTTPSVVGRQSMSRQSNCHSLRCRILISNEAIEPSSATTALCPRALATLDSLTSFYNKYQLMIAVVLATVSLDQPRCMRPLRLCSRCVALQQQQLVPGLGFSLQRTRAAAVLHGRMGHLGGHGRPAPGSAWCCAAGARAYGSEAQHAQLRMQVRARPPMPAWQWAPANGQSS